MKTAVVPLTAEHPRWGEAAAFAEALYGELYFPALKLLTGDETNEKIRTFIGSTIDAQFIPFV